MAGLPLFFDPANLMGEVALPLPSGAGMLPVGTPEGTVIPFNPELVQEPPGARLPQTDEEVFGRLAEAKQLIQAVESQKAKTPGFHQFNNPRTWLALADVVSANIRRAGRKDGDAGGTGVVGSGSLYALALKEDEAERRVAADERKAVLDAQKLQLDMLRTYSQMSVDQTNAFKNTLESVGQFRKQAPLATEDEMVGAERVIGERFRAIRVPVPPNFVRAMVRVPKVAELAGTFAPFMEDPAFGGRMAVIAAGMYGEGKGSEIPKLLEEQGTPFVRHEAGQVFAAVARELKALPEYRDKELPFETVVSAMRAIPGKGQGYALALQNQLGRRESYADWLDTVDFRGVERPDVTAAARKAGAVKTAERGAEVAAEMPRLEPGVLAELARITVDPRKATTEQIETATRAAEDRAVAFETRKRRATQAVEAGKPLTEAERNRLRLDYRQEARQVVLSTEPGGIFGALDKLEPAAKHEIERRIDAKAAELAGADGLGSLFPRAAARPAPPPPPPTLRWDPKKKMLVPVR